MSTASTPLAPPKIAHPVFLGFMWSGTGVSLSFVIFRLIVKIRSYGKVYSDDYLVVAAWVLLLGSAVLWQFMSPNLYDLFAVTSGQKPLTPDFITKNADLLRAITPFSLLFYSCLLLGFGYIVSHQVRSGLPTTLTTAIAQPMS
ncbi:MAG: hypothetical protein Q9221_006570 [Calogaya cf. arnoldii]